MNRFLQLWVFIIVGLAVHVGAFAQERGGTAWTPVPGKGVDISINTDGQGYVAGPDGTPWRWDKVEQRWRRMSGNFVRITAAEGNRPWAVDAEGVVYRYNGLWWEDKDTGVADVAANAQGQVYIAKTSGEIKQWYALRSEWRPVPGRARRLAVGSGDALWAVAPDGSIRRFDGKEWHNVPGRAVDIAVGGTDVVMIADAGGQLRTWNGTEQRWAVVPGVGGVGAVAVTPDGAAWVVIVGGAILSNGGLGEATAQEQDKAKTLRAERPTATGAVPAPLSAPTPVASAPAAKPETAESLGSGAAPEVTGSSTTATTAGDPATLTTKNKITFINTLQTISSLAIGADGSVFGLDAGGTVMRWSNAERTFNTFPGSLVRIAVDKDGNPWGVSSLGRVFHHDGSQWRQIYNATAADIAVGYGGDVVIANAAGRLYRLNGAGTRFDMIPGNGVAVAVAPDGAPWTIRSDKLVQRCDVSPCKVLAQRALSLSIGPDGSVWIVSDRNLLMRLNKDGKTFATVQTPGHTPWKVAVGPSGYPWVVSEARLALASTYFDRNEQGDTRVASATSGDTSGSGATATVTDSSASAFTFSKNMLFETVDFSTLNSNYYAVLASDVDGVIWAHTGNGSVDTYSASKKKFIDAQTKFASEFYTLEALDVASNGDLWAYATNPSTGIFRERNKVIKQYSVSGLTPDTVAVSPDDTVYAVFHTGSTYYLYKKPSNSEVFTKVVQDDILDISVGPGNDIWMVDRSNYVQQWTGTRFEKRPASGQKANKVAVGKTDGTVYILDNNNDLHKWNSTNGSFDKVNNASGYYVAIDKDGRPWINTNDTPVIKRGKD